MPSSDPRPKKPASRVSRGHAFESEAAALLEAQGFELVARNWRTGHKEIDLIVRKDNLLVFVEVKSSRSISYGHPAERVDKRKINNLVEAAEIYLQQHNITGCDLRFDVITFTDGQPEHYPNAFSKTED